MTDRFDAIVAGGGLNGTALALALGRAGLRAALVDRLPAETRKARDFDGRSYALAHGSYRLLTALGLWPALADHAQPIRHIQVIDGPSGERTSPLTLDFDQGEIEEGPMGYMVEDRHLRRALLVALAETPGVTHRAETVVADHHVDETEVTVDLENGDQLQAAVLIGADGAGSATATRAGIRRQGWSYGQTALVCALSHSEPHDGTARQVFLPAGPLAMLPLTGDRSSIVWTERDAAAAQIQALDDAGYLAALAPRIGGRLGRIALAGTRFTYPLGLSLAERFVAPRVALLGDAAHRVHPIAGQGLNAGLKDVAALAETLALAKRRGEDIGRLDVLDRYQLWRRFDTATLALATDTFNRLFSNDNPILRLGRDLGMGAVNAMPALRRAAIREAAGLSGDLPRLLRGQPI